MPQGVSIWPTELVTTTLGDSTAAAQVRISVDQPQEERAQVNRAITPMLMHTFAT